MKAKYNQLASGNKVPTSLTTMETQLKKNEKEVSILQKQFDKLMDKVDFRNANKAKETINASPEYKVNYDLQTDKLFQEAMNLGSQLDGIKQKSKNLEQSINEIKINPQSSIEAQNLKAKIDLVGNSLNESKKEASDLAISIEKVGKSRFSKLGIEAKTISSGFKEVNNKLDKFKNKMTR